LLTLAAKIKARNEVEQFASIKLCSAQTSCEPPRSVHEFEDLTALGISLPARNGITPEKPVTQDSNGMRASRCSRLAPNVGMLRRPMANGSYGSSQELL